MNRSRLLVIAAHALVWSTALVYLCGYAATYDLWAYLSQGRLIWETGAIPRVDHDSYLPTGPWICHNWLASALLYPFYLAGGGAALRVITLVFMVGALVLAYRSARSAGASPLGTLLVVALAIPSLSVGGMPFRPAMISFVLLVLLLHALRAGRVGWWIPVLFVAWVNLHAGVLIGLVVMGLWTVGSWREPATMKRLAILTAASAAATLVNPYHVRYWWMVWEILGDRNKDITEWQPVAWLTNHYPEFQVLVALTLAVLLAARLRDARCWLVLALMAYAGSRQIRQIPLLGLAAVVLLPPIIEPWLRRLRERETWAPMPLLERLLPAAAAALAGLIVGLWFRSEPWRLRVPDRPNASGIYYPVGSVEFMKAQRLRGNLAVFFPWGEYAAWQLHGQCRVSADGRHVSVFTRDAVNRSIDFSLGRDGWRALLSNYPTTLVLMPSSSPVTQALQREPGWKLLYADTGSALFAKTAERLP
ncbi:MAG: hypothetical protein HZC54_05655 [Verrucomicrobia bacterium]|nr:hypothetical protein [Verrucomicrobiota bacterium]